MTDDFEVEKILASKKSRGRTLYKIRWRTFGPEDDTWEPVTHLKGCQELLDEFHENQAPKKNRKKPQHKVVINTEIDASKHTTLRTTTNLSDTSREVDSLTVSGGRRALHDNGSFQRSVLRETYTTAIHTTLALNTGSLSKRKRSQNTETNISSGNEDDPPLSPLYAAMCIVGIALAIVFIYFTS